MEKLDFALIMASEKLRHYIQAHEIIVMIDHPLKKVMNKLEAAGQLIQWAIELSEFDIRYQPRNEIKAQALVDFIAEFTSSHGDLDEMEGNKTWVVHVNRHGKTGGSGRVRVGSKRVTGQNGSFLNGSIGLRVKRVTG